MYCWLRLKVGTGKSTLVKYIIAALGLQPEEVAYVAFTGKASQVLAQKGCPNATTAHKLLYYSRQNKDGSFKFIPRKSFENSRLRLIIVDEVSMLPNSMWQLLLSHNIHVIALGDPGQLSPINPLEDNHILEFPHIFLDEIMRQALDSGIIRLSMLVRESKSIDNFKSDDALVLSKNELNTGMLQWAD